MGLDICVSVFPDISVFVAPKSLSAQGVPGERFDWDCWLWLIAPFDL